MLLGYAFASWNHCLDATPITPILATKVIVSSAVFDEIFATNGALDYSTDIPQIWDYGTIMHGYFDGNTLAGNVGFYISEVNKLRVKRRKKGDTNWTALYDQNVDSVDDLKIDWYDITPRSNETYEYAIVPVFDQIEGSFYSSEITTDFCGLIISDKTGIFQTELDVTMTEQRNKPRSVISPVNRKYPIVVVNGANDYDSGSVSAQFLEYNPDNDSWDNGNSHQHLGNLKDFLNSGTPKLLKYEDGRMWLVEVSSSAISGSENNATSRVYTSFEWAEIGDCDSAAALYENDLIDIEAGVT